LHDSRFLDQKDVTLGYALEALGSQFRDAGEIEAYLAALANDTVRNEFLRLSSFYLFLVKTGEWVNERNGARDSVGYLTETYRTVALFGLIEAAGGQAFQDFNHWLLKRGEFPVADAKHLKALHEAYLDSYGSIRRCLRFFRALTPATQKRLCAGVELDGEPMQKIEAVARFLYTLRSKFVHESRLVLEMNDGLMVSTIDKKTATVRLSIEDLMAAFEEGLVHTFRQMA
jgi:hypothetical protein